MGVSSVCWILWTFAKRCDLLTMRLSASRPCWLCRQAKSFLWTIWAAFLVGSTRCSTFSQPREEFSSKAQVKNLLIVQNKFDWEGKRDGVFLPHFVDRIMGDFHKLLNDGLRTCPLGQVGQDLDSYHILSIIYQASLSTYQGQILRQKICCILWPVCCKNEAIAVHLIQDQVHIVKIILFHQPTQPNTLQISLSQLLIHLVQ